MVFAKAYSLVAQEMPRLRQSYLSFPFPRLYQHPESAAIVSVVKEYQGEEALFFARLRAPDRQSLSGLSGYLRHLKTVPFHEVSAFRQALRCARLWRPLRRLVWWCGLNLFGARRAHHFGTFGISVYSSLGVDSLHPLAPSTVVLNYGPIAPDGQVDVRLVYDHRVLDGMVVARALRRLEEVLTGPIVHELQGMADTTAGDRREAA
jgi:hypothetical protein